MTAGLKVVKLTPKQYKLVSELTVYFEMRLDHCLRMRKSDPWYEEPIPLLKIYRAKKCNAQDRKAVLIAANIFFKRSTRGDNQTGKCSTWEPRPQLHINNQVRQMIIDLYKDNIEHISNLRTFLNTPEKENAVEVTTTFKFKTKEQAIMFAKLVVASMEEDDDTAE